jgi:hypothetical protein
MEPTYDGCVRVLAMSATLLAMGAPAIAQETAPSGRPGSNLVVDLNFLIGQKYLDRDDWGSKLDEQFATGLETTWSRPGWRAGVAVDAVFANAEKRSGSFSDEVILRGSTLEIAIGVRAIVPIGRVVRPFAGAGAELAQGDVQTIRRGGTDEAHGGGGTGWRRSTRAVSMRTRAG